MTTTNRRRTQFATVASIAIAAALVAAATQSPARSALTPATTAPTAGAATGGYENGLPVYRLPAVTVTASRSAELAKMAREERVALK